MLRADTQAFIIRFLTIAAVAVVVRVLAILLVFHPEIAKGGFEFRDDERQYHSLAATLVSAGRYSMSADGPPSALRPPGVIVPIAIFYRAFGIDPAVAVGYIILCSVLLVLVLGALARITHGTHAVVTVSMLFGACLPTLIFTSSGIWSDPPALLFMLAALYFVIRPVNERQADLLWPLAAFALALAYLNRPAGALVVALVLPLLALKTLRARHFGRLALMFVLAAAPVFAWGLRNQLVLGSFFIGNTEAGYAFYTGTNEVSAGLQDPVIGQYNGYDLAREAARGEYLGSAVIPAYVTAATPRGDGATSELEINAWYQERVVRFISENPRAYLRLLGYRLLRLLTAAPIAPSILGESPERYQMKQLATFVERWIVLFFGCWGMAWLYRSGHPHRNAYLLFLVGNFAIFAVAWVNARSFLPTAGVLVVPAAIGIAQLGRSLNSRRQRRAVIEVNRS